MTDREKLEKVRAEIERLKHQSAIDSDRQAERGLQSASISSFGKVKACEELLSFIDSIQKEPKECMYSKDNFTDEDRKVLCDGCEEECEYSKKEEPVNDNFEVEVKKLWEEINTGHNYSIVDSYNQFYGLCVDIAEWQKEQLMAKAVDATVHIDAGGYPYIPQMELYDYDKDIPLAKEGEKVKVIVIKEE